MPGLSGKIASLAFENACRAFSVTDTAESVASAVDEFDDSLKIEQTKKIGDTLILRSGKSPHEKDYFDYRHNDGDHENIFNPALHSDENVCDPNPSQNQSQYGTLNDTATQYNISVSSLTLWSSKPAKNSLDPPIFSGHVRRHWPLEG